MREAAGFGRKNEDLDRHFENVCTVEFRYLCQLLNNGVLRVVVVIDVEEVEDGVERVAEIRIHADPLLHLVEKHHILFALHPGVHLVV